MASVFSPKVVDRALKSFCVLCQILPVSLDCSILDCPFGFLLTFILIYQGFRVYFPVPINWTAAGDNIYKCPRKK
jgi:hypothetical protein